MFCINCFHKNTKTVNSRPHKKQPQVWRRRQCPECSTTFTTYERPSLADNKKVTDSNIRFNTGWLTISIAESFTHDPLRGKENAFWLAQSVEDFLSLKKEALTTTQISHVTYEVLKRYDALAALQYAAKHQLISSVRKRGRPSLYEHEQPLDESPSQ